MKCPCCGSETFEIPVAGIAELPGFSVSERKIVHALIARYPHGLTGLQLQDAVYPNGNAGRVEAIRTFVATARKKLVGSGWTISRGEFNSATASRYRMERVDEAAS